jgi:hypothetical protein
LCHIAERRSYGLRSKDSILYDDDSEDALFFWELSNTALLPAHLQRNLGYARAQRATVREKVRSLDKLIGMIERASSVEKDVPRIVEEYERYNRVVRKEVAAR